MFRLSCCCRDYHTQAGRQGGAGGGEGGLVAKHIRREGLVGSSNGWIEVFKVTIFVLRPILDGAAVKRG